MGEQLQFQPLTREDRISVLLYRAGIAASAFILVFAAYAFFGTSRIVSVVAPSVLFALLLAALAAAAGLSVVFIHLYVSRFHRALKRLFGIALAALLLLFILGKGDAYDVLTTKAYGPLLLIPLAGCLGFIAAKEAFCFRLFEGYLLALIMPLVLLFAAGGALTRDGVAFSCFVVAGLFLLFTMRKIFMPIHYDIGDKSAYT